MTRRPPRSTRTDTLFPYTTLFRARRPAVHHRAFADMGAQIDEAGHQHRARRDIGAAPHDRAGNGAKARLPEIGLAPALELRRPLVTPMRGEARPACDERSDERLVGKECVSTGRSRWMPAHLKKNR